MPIYHRFAQICTWSLFDLCLICVDLHKICVDQWLIYDTFTSIYINLKRIWLIYAWFVTYEILWCAVTQTCQLAFYRQTEMRAQHATSQIYVTNVGTVVLWKDHAVTANSLEIIHIERLWHCNKALNLRIHTIGAIDMMTLRLH